MKKGICVRLCGEEVVLQIKRHMPGPLHLVLPEASPAVDQTTHLKVESSSSSTCLDL